VCIFGGSASFINLPWNQLTRLDLNEHAQDVDSALEVLKQTPNLEVLSIWPSDSYDGQHTPIVMENLHTLRLHPSSFWHFFEFLAVPTLKTLELGFPIESDLDILLSFISRSSCTVPVLHLHNQAPEEIVECLQLFESLEDLTIQNGNLWHTRCGEEYYSEIEDDYCPIVFGFLKERGQLPAVKSLSFVDFPMAIDTALLTSMLNSRRRSRGVANLESFKLVFTHPEGYEEAHASKLRSLVDRG
jgi:hypothetical protein